jgi:hypothetical protein
MHVPATPARVLAALLGLTAAACAPQTAPAPAPASAASAAPAQAPEQGVFITRLGTDTLSVERYTRTASRLEGEMVVRSPYTTVRRYTAEIRPDGTLGRFETTLEAPGASRPMPTLRHVVEPGGDSLTVRIHRGDSTRVLRVAAPGGALPFYRSSYALYEQLLRQARATGGDSATVLTYTPGAPRTSPLRVRITGPDAAVLGDVAGPVPTRTDARGRILAAGPTQAEMTIERAEGVDVAALAADFARRDREGRGLGTLSPADSLQATVGGARIAVKYGRPFRRGRKVMGGVVGWDQVWRAGANEATEFRTDRDLVVGGTPIPAGTYTLWALPSASGWRLIFNKRTGQWGTEYHAEDDLARIPAQAETLPQMVEQLTYSIEPRGERAGVLALSWENTRVSVPFTVK